MASSSESKTIHSLSGSGCVAALSSHPATFDGADKANHIPRPSHQCCNGPQHVSGLQLHAGPAVVAHVCRSKAPQPVLADLKG